MVGLSRQYTGLQKRWFPALQWDLLMMGSSYTQLRLKTGGFPGVAPPELSSDRSSTSAARAQCCADRRPGRT